MCATPPSQAIAYRSSARTLRLSQHSLLNPHTLITRLQCGFCKAGFGTPTCSEEIGVPCDRPSDSLFQTELRGPPEQTMRFFDGQILLTNFVRGAVLDHGVKICATHHLQNLVYQFQDREPHFHAEVKCFTDEFGIISQMFSQA